MWARASFEAQIFGWWDAFGRPWWVGRFGLGVSCHWKYLWLQGAVSPGFNSLWRGWVYRLAPEAPLLGECQWGPRHFWKCRAHVGSGPAPEPTLKNALCHTRPVDGTEDNTSSDSLLLSLMIEFHHFFQYKRCENVDISWYSCRVVH